MKPGFDDWGIHKDWYDRYYKWRFLEGRSMKPIDAMPSFAPQRTEVQVDDVWIVHVKPPKLIGGDGVKVVLNKEQYDRYCQWRRGDVVLIQDALPELDASQREGLMTGLTDEDFAAMITGEGEAIMGEEE